MEDNITVTDLEEIEAPWGARVRLQNLDHEGGMSLLRVRILQGKRITDLSLDPDTARKLVKSLTDWADAHG